MTNKAAPLLRSPPLLGAAAAVSSPGNEAAPGVFGDDDAIDRVFGAIRAGRVGGCFWARPLDHPGPSIIVRPRAAAEIEQLATRLSEAERLSACCLLPARERNHIVPTPAPFATIISDEIDPWSLLRPGVRLLAHGDDEWLALAHIQGGVVEVLSPGRFGAPGMTGDEIRARVAQDLGRARYRDPFTDHAATLEIAIDRLADWRRVFEANRGIVAACGIAWWKRHEIARFLANPEQPLRFFRSETLAIRSAARQGGAIAVWPSRVSAGMAGAAAARNVPLVRVEDGFLRSVGLGSNLVPPSSVTVDRSGIYYDPSRQSDLESLLANAVFTAPLIERAERLRAAVLQAGISKYGVGTDGAGKDHPFPERRPGRRLVLVPGQVEDDLSVRAGGGGLASNLELLRRARELEPDAEIWFRPHPDVDAGHRKGAVPDAEALQIADCVVRGGGMAALLARVDAVHVLTSLTGFEALLRGLPVTCHGVPFFAGWGLTRDLAPVPGTRGRPLSLAQLVAAVLILYPRYLDPVTKLPCPPEVLIERMRSGAAHNRLGWVSRLRQVQGRVSRALRRPLGGNRERLS